MKSIGRPPRLAVFAAALAIAAGAVPDLSARVEARGPRGEFARRYEEARRRYDTKDFAGAAAEYEAAYDLNRDPKLLFSAGNARLMAGQAEEALRFYERCERHDPPLDATYLPALREARALAEQQLRPDPGGKPGAAEGPAGAAPGAAAPTGAAASAGAGAGAAVAAAGASSRAPGARLALVPGTGGPATPTKVPLVRSPWLWVPLSLVVAAGVTTAAVLGSRGSSPSDYGVLPANQFQFALRRGASW